MLKGVHLEAAVGDVIFMLGSSGSGKSTFLRCINLPEIPDAGTVTVHGGAFRRALPAYSNEVIFMLHSSVVLSTITLQDILGVGRWLNGRYYLAYEGFITAMLFYRVLVFFISRCFRIWEKFWLGHLRPREE